MKVYNNNSYPIKIKYRNTDKETINVYGFRSVFYPDTVNVISVTTDNTSTVVFMNERVVELPDITVQSNQLLLTDRDATIKDQLIINGELRII